MARKTALKVLYHSGRIQEEEEVGAEAGVARVVAIVVEVERRKILSSSSDGRLAISDLAVQSCQGLLCDTSW